MIETTIRRGGALVLLCTAATLWAGGNNEQQAPAPRDPGDRIDIPDPQSRDSQDDTEERDFTPDERPLWILAEHRRDETLLEEIGRIVADGYVPAGFDVKDDTASVIYIASATQLTGAIAILPIERPDDLESEITAALQGNMVPAGMSFAGRGMSVLLVEVPENTVRGWEIDLVDATDLEGLVASYEQYGERGFVAAGLALNRTTETFWILYLDTQSSVGTLINGFPFEEVRLGIAEDVQSGAIPSGITRSEGAYFVQYLFQN